MSERMAASLARTFRLMLLAARMPGVRIAAANRPAGGRRRVTFRFEWDDGPEWQETPEPPPTVAKTLAIAVLLDDDRAAAALADLLQEHGIDAIAEARRQGAMAERERVGSFLRNFGNHIGPARGRWDDAAFYGDVATQVEHLEANEDELARAVAAHAGWVTEQLLAREH